MDTHQPAIGQLLTVERINKKLSQKEVAKQLNLNVAVIEALEDDLPIENVSATYVRGYQRAYVRLLGLDEDEVLGELVDHTRDAKLQEQMHYLDASISRAKPAYFRYIPTLAIIVAVLALGIAGWPKLQALLQPVHNSQVTQTVGDGQQKIELVVNTSSNQPADQPEPVETAGDDNTLIAADVEKVMVNQADDLRSVVEIAAKMDFEAQAAEAEAITLSTNSAQTQQDVASVQSGLSEVEPVIQTDTDTNLQYVTQTIALPTQVAAEQIESNTNTIDTGTKLSELLNQEETAGNSSESDEINTDVSLLSVNQQDSEAKITFIANGESWLSITDADNNRLYRNTLKLDRVTVSGNLPLRVSTGNLKVLRLSADQGEAQKVDIFSDNKTVAKFNVELDADGRLKFLPR